MQGLPALADRPVIFMSAHGRDETIARALDVAATDYVVKPFSPTGLVARVQVALRKRASPDKPYRLGELAIHHEERRVTLAGQPIPLTPTEYDLLHALAANAGRVSTLDYLLRRVCRSRRGKNPRIVRVYIKRLRDKLGDDPKNPTYVFTEPRVGYRTPRPRQRLSLAPAAGHGANTDGCPCRHASVECEFIRQIGETPNEMAHRRH